MGYSRGGTTYLLRHAVHAPTRRGGHYIYHAVRITTSTSRRSCSFTSPRYPRTTGCGPLVSPPPTPADSQERGSPRPLSYLSTLTPLLYSLAYSLRVTATTPLAGRPLPRSPWVIWSFVFGGGTLLPPCHPLRTSIVTHTPLPTRRAAHADITSLPDIPRSLSLPVGPSMLQGLSACTRLKLAAHGGQGIESLCALPASSWPSGPLQHAFFRRSHSVRARSGDFAACVRAIACYSPDLARSGRLSARRPSPFWFDRRMRSLEMRDPNSCVVSP